MARGKDAAFIRKVALAPDPVTTLEAWDTVLGRFVEVVLLAMKSHLARVPDAEV
jgi:hypothetical protein